MSFSVASSLRALLFGALLATGAARLLAQDAPPATTTPADVRGDSDRDGDGLTDTEEANTYNTNPDVADTDGDGLRDGDEVKTYRTNPRSRDTDGDNLPDNEEIQRRTNPIASDTDGDGYSDGSEVYAYGTDPTDPNSHPGTAKGTTDACNGAVELTFDEGSAVLDPINRPDNFQKLDALVECLGRCREMKLLIVGHASPDGSRAANDRLSEMRANEIFVYLLSRGVDEARVEDVYGRGSRSPRAVVRGLLTEHARRYLYARDRRVVIYLLNTCNSTRGSL